MLFIFKNNIITFIFLYKEKYNHKIFSNFFPSSICKETYKHQILSKFFPDQCLKKHTNTKYLVNFFPDQCLMANSNIIRTKCDSDGFTLVFYVILKQQ